MKYLPLAAALAFAACPSLAQANPGLANPLLPPIGKWEVDFSATHCTAARAYGSEGEPVLLAFRPSVTDDLVRLTIVRPGKDLFARHSPITVAFRGEEVQSSALRFPSGGEERETVWIYLDGPAMERLASADEVEIELERSVRLRFALQDMPAVSKLLKECTDDLRGHWNVEGSRRVEIAEPATPVGPSSWLSDRDYPSSARRAEESGKVAFILMVDETGAAADCSVEGTSGSAILDATGCVRLLERARFKPALDSDGNPVRSVYRSSIHWVLP